MGYVTIHHIVPGAAQQRVKNVLRRKLELPYCPR